MLANISQQHMSQQHTSQQHMSPQHRSQQHSFFEIKAALAQKDIDAAQVERRGQNCNKLQRHCSFMNDDINGELYLTAAKLGWGRC